MCWVFKLKQFFCDFTLINVQVIKLSVKGKDFCNNLIHQVGFLSFVKNACPHKNSMSCVCEAN